MNSSAPENQEFQTLINHRFELGETLWRGGMGTVYQALDRSTGRTLSLKILEGSQPIAPERLLRFKQEFRLTPGLVPPGAWEAYDTGLSDQGLFFMTLECFKEPPGPSQGDTRRLELLNGLSRTISGTMDLPEILRAVLLAALEVSQAEQGAVFWGTEILLALNRAGQDISDPRISLSVVKEVLEEGRSLSILDTQEDSRFAVQASIMDLQLRFIMGVPLRAGLETRGVLYVSSRSITKSFGPEDLEMLEAIASQVALALETAQSYQTIRELNQDLEKKVEMRTHELQATLGELKKAQAQLVQSEKMAGMGHLVAGVAHELNNPLNFIYGNLKVLRDYTGRLQTLVGLYEDKALDEAALARQKDDLDFNYVMSDLPKTLDSCLNGAIRAQKIVSDLKTFSGLDESELNDFDLASGLESAIAVAQGRFPQVSYEFALKANLHLKANGKQLNQAFLAVLSNAGQAIAQKGLVKVTLELQALEALITIQDTGCGIPSEELPKLFDPFFTTRPVGQGTGLGLTLAYSVINAHNGLIEVASTLGAGTTVTLRLPLNER